MRETDCRVRRFGHDSRLLDWTSGDWRLFDTRFSPGLFLDRFRTRSQAELQRLFGRLLSDAGLAEVFNRVEEDRFALQELRLQLGIV